ncbi:hypothetical protein [Natrinema hispanicum]|nr:hypothetical protein [Natrinema hispanicum]
MLTDRREDLVLAVALAEFSVHYEAADPVLAEHAWQLAADHLLEHDVELHGAVRQLNIELATTL